MKIDDKRSIYRQMEAEFAFALSLEAEGLDPERFMAAWGLTLHQFNILAHTVYGVSEEAVSLPVPLQALLRARQEASDTRIAA